MNSYGSLYTRTQRLWVLEDDPGAVFVYRDILEMRYSLQVFQDLQSFQKAILFSGENALLPPALLIADLRLGSQFFLDFVKSSYTQFTFPFVVVSSIDDTDILRSCFKWGAVDYLTKPFKKSELLVKLERWLSTKGKQFHFDKIQLDPGQLSVSSLRGKQKLTAKEFQIFHLINASPNHALTRREIMDYIWEGAKVEPKALNVHLHSLRRKLLPIGIDISHQPPDVYAIDCN